MENPNMLLAARLRLDFSAIQVGPPVPVRDHLLRSALCMSFRGIFEVEVRVSESDVVYTKFFRSGSGRKHSDPERRVVREGRVYLRDLSFVPEWAKITNLPKYRLREFLRDKLSALEMTIVHGGAYEFRAALPLCDNANEMMNLVAQPFSGPTLPIHNPYTIVIQDVPCQWFSDTNHSKSSKPSHQRVLSFFQHMTFGKITNLDTSENHENATYCNVVIQYENYPDCYKALKRLCSFSLLKVEKGGPKMTADYEVMWKDFVYSVSPEVHPNKNSCENSVELASKQVSVASDGQVMLKNEMAVLQGQFRTLEAKLEDSGA